MQLSLQKFRNIPEYAKLGYGVLATAAGISYVLRHVNTRRTAEEVLYRGIDNPSSEKLLEAYENFDKHIKSNADNTEVNKAALGLMIGLALIASGIWNLARNYRREQQD